MLDLAATLLFAFAPQTPPPAAAPPTTVVIEGRVVDLRGEGVPVAAITVTSRREPDVVLAKAVSDGDGFFRIAKVPPGEGWRVTAAKDGMCMGMEWTSAPPKPLRLELHDAATVRGVLRDRAGKPVAGATVRAQMFARILFSVRCDATTGADGAFALTGVPLGLVRIAALVPGEGIVEARVHVAGDTTVGLSPGSGKTTTLAVEVAGLPKEALAKLGASILPYDQGHLTELPPPWHKPTFDAEGRFELSPAPDLEYRVSLGLEGYAFEPNERRVKPGASSHRLQFVAKAVGSADLRCKAVLKDADGKPVPGVPLVMRRANGGVQTKAVSGEDGTVEFASKLGAGTAVIVYSTDPRWVLDQDKQPGRIGSLDRRSLVEHECKVDPSTTLELRAAPACSVRGTVHLADGRPAAFVEVHLQEEDANRLPRWMTFAYAVTDRDGAYGFTGRHWLPDAVRVQIEGVWGAATGEPFALEAPGKQVVVPELTLTPPAVIEGLVLDAGKQPAPGVRVWLRDWDLARGDQRSGSIEEVITDRQGRYRFVGVPPGGAYLQVLIDDPFPTAQAVPPFEVEAGKTYTFELAAPAK